jgi:hypothetical protein
LTNVRAENQHDVLIRRLSTLSSGATAVMSVDVKEDYWPDERPIQIVLHLTEPAGETWDVDDIIELRRQMNEVLSDVGVLSFVRTTLTGGEPVEDDDDDSE